jgi:PPOX class probable F420-dependent enzyme
MAKRRNEVAMSADETAAFLDEQRVLNVATNGPTGHPHLVAMWYVMIDGRPTFWTFGKSQKVVNLRRDPKISALVETGDSYNELRGVEIEGTARLIEDYEAVLDIGKRVAEKYNGPEGTSELALPFLEKQAHKRIGVAIDVERTASWDHRKISGY